MEHTHFRCAMNVIYFDESKSNLKDGRDWYIVGGISLPMSAVATVEEEISEISREFFDSDELIPETEFHGIFLYQGKGPCKGMPVEKRMEIFDRLFAILAREEIMLVYAAINTPKLYNELKAAELAFMHFCERAQGTIIAGNHGILIGDLDDEQSKSMVSDFSRYRKVGTSSKYGSLITKIVDSVHFTRSHHSRLIQLADVYVYALSNRYHPKKNGWVNDLYKEVRARHDLFPCRYKEWPRA